MDIKKIVIIFSMLLMISGATISVLKWLEIGPFAVEDETQAAAEDEVVPEAPPISIPLEAMHIPIFTDETIAATVMIKISIEVVGPENEAKVTKILPRLGDAFFKDLYVFIPRVIRRQNKLSPGILVERLKLTATKVTEPGVIKNIIIDEVSES